MVYLSAKSVCERIQANYALSYADAFIVALAQEENGIILTGDPEFQSVTEIVHIEWLNP
ncbi:MAG: PIN domain-containing protein [Anaerolineales bacterium]|nr:PIN domain-containing protein [Anaerolineales bacterium]